MAGGARRDRIFDRAVEDTENAWAVTPVRTAASLAAAAVGVTTVAVVAAVVTTAVAAVTATSTAVAAAAAAAFLAALAVRSIYKLSFANVLVAAAVAGAHTAGKGVKRRVQAGLAAIEPARDAFHEVRRDWGEQERPTRRGWRGNSADSLGSLSNESVSTHSSADGFWASGPSGLRTQAARALGHAGAVFMALATFDRAYEEERARQGRRSERGRESAARRWQDKQDEKEEAQKRRNDDFIEDLDDGYLRFRLPGLAGVRSAVRDGTTYIASKLLPGGSGLAASDDSRSMHSIVRLPIPFLARFRASGGSDIDSHSNASSDATDRYGRVREDADPPRFNIGWQRVLGFFRRGHQSGERVATNRSESNSSYYSYTDASRSDTGYGSYSDDSRTDIGNDSDQYHEDNHHGGASIVRGYGGNNGNGDGPSHRGGDGTPIFGYPRPLRPYSPNDQRAKSDASQTSTADSQSVKPPASRPRKLQKQQKGRSSR